MTSSASHEIDSARLLGFMDPVGGHPGFVLPVFTHELAGTLIQDIDPRGRVARFSRFSLDDEQESGLIREPRHELVVSRDDRGLYAFAFRDGSIVAGNQSYLSKHLEENLGKLGRAHFVKLDVLRFVGSVDRARDQVRRIRNVMSLDNPQIADRWAKVQLGVLEERVAASTYEYHPDVGPYWGEEGVLSYPELLRKLEVCVASEEVEVEVQMKLVRSCIGRSDVFREHVRTLGLNPARCNVVARPIVLRRPSMSLLRRLMSVVMLVRCIIRGDDVIVVSPADETKLWQRYYKKREDKRLTPRNRIDFVYGVNRWGE